MLIICGQVWWGKGHVVVILAIQGLVYILGKSMSFVLCMGYHTKPKNFQIHFFPQFVFLFLFCLPCCRMYNRKGRQFREKSICQYVIFSLFGKPWKWLPTSYIHYTMMCRGFLHWHFKHQILFVNSSFAVLHYIYYTRAPIQGRCAASLRHGLNRNWELLMFFFEHY